MKPKVISTWDEENTIYLPLTHGEIKQMQEKIIYYTIPLFILEKIGQPINFTNILKSNFDISPTEKTSWEQVVALIKQRGVPEKANKEQ